MAASWNYFQLKTLVFEKVELQKGYPDRVPEQIESQNKNTMFLADSPRKVLKDFWKFRLYVEKIDFDYGPRYLKMSKFDIFVGNSVVTFLRTDKEFIFPWIYSFLNVVEGNIYSRPGKNFYV